MRAAIVTGAGTGIGAAVARRFAADGLGVLLVGRRSEPLEEVARGLGHARVVAADVGEEATAEQAVATAREAFGGLDVLVNNAGVGDSAPALEETLESWERTL